MWLDVGDTYSASMHQEATVCCQTAILALSVWKCSRSIQDTPPLHPQSRSFNPSIDPDQQAVVCTSVSSLMSRGRASSMSAAVPRGTAVTSGSLTHTRSVPSFPSLAVPCIASTAIINSAKDPLQSCVVQPAPCIIIRAKHGAAVHGYGPQHKGFITADITMAMQTLMQ